LLRGWRKIARDRDACTLILREVRVLDGPYGHWKRRRWRTRKRRKRRRRRRRSLFSRKYCDRGIFLSWSHELSNDSLSRFSGELGL
jgi:hypothetical protein